MDLTFNMSDAIYTGELSQSSRNQKGRQIDSLRAIVRTSQQSVLAVKWLVTKLVGEQWWLRLPHYYYYGGHMECFDG